MEGSSNTPTPASAGFIASYPFTPNDSLAASGSLSHTVPKADIILRSCDEPQVDFYVHRAVLALSSPFFADLFSLPQPRVPKDDSRDASSGKDEQELPVVQVSERAEILDKALRFFYPGTSPFSDSAFTSSRTNPDSNDADSRYPLDDLRQILEILVLKYQVEAVIPLGKRLLREHLDSDAVGMFVVACGMRWDDVAREAAWRSLRRPIRQFVESDGDSASDSPAIPSFPRPTPSSPLLMHLPASTYHALLTYHATCSTIAFNSTTTLLWLPYASVPGADCTNWNHPELCLRVGHWTFAERTLAPVTKWFAACLDWVGERLEEAPLFLASESLRLDHDKDDRKDIEELLSLAVREIGACESCRKDGFPALLRFLGILRRRVEGEVAKLEIALNF